MAGVMAALFGGGKTPPVDTNPLPGIGGYALGPGPAGQTGFPGSTRQTRTLQGNNPRPVKVRADTNTGFEQALGRGGAGDRKSTRLNSSHTVISYAVFCLKKKK